MLLIDPGIQSQSLTHPVDHKDPECKLDNRACLTSGNDKSRAAEEIESAAGHYKLIWAS
jgi:hypothetical protein